MFNVFFITKANDFRAVVSTKNSMQKKRVPRDFFTAQAQGVMTRSLHNIRSSAVGKLSILQYYTDSAPVLAIKNKWKPQINIFISFNKKW